MSLCRRADRCPRVRGVRCELRLSFRDRGIQCPCRIWLVVRHVIIFGHGHGLQRAIIDESQHRTPERLIMAQH